MYNVKSKAVILTLVIVVFAVSVCQAATHAASDVSNDEQNILLVVQKYLMSQGTQDWAGWRSALSQRWRESISDAAVAGLNESYGRVDAKVAISRVVAYDAKTAVVEYQLSFSGKEPRDIERCYLVNEGGSWFVDSAFDIPPVWALTGEKKSLYSDDILNLLTEYNVLILSRDTTGLGKFMDAHFSSDALAEFDANDLVLAPGYAGRLLTPISMTVLDVQHAGEDTAVEVWIGRIEGMRKGTDKEAIHVRNTGCWFVKQDGQWKFLRQRPLRAEEVVARFLKLWRQGDIEKMEYLLTPDARVHLANGVENAWRDTKNALPAVENPKSVVTADSENKAAGAWTLTEGKAGAETERVFIAHLDFAKSAAWPSGQYAFSTRATNRYGITSYRISQLRWTQ